MATATSNATADARHKSEETVDRVSQGAHEAIDAIEHKAKQGIEAGRRKALDAVNAAEELEARAELALDETTRKVSRYVQEKPLQAAGIAFAAGVLTTLLMRRR